MSILIKKHWTQQPPVGAQIDFGHPLSKGLTFYILFNAAAGTQRALLPAALPSTVVGTQPGLSWKANGLGIGEYFDGNYGLWWERGLWNEPPTNLSVVCRKRRTGTIANQDTRVSFKTFGNTGVSPFISYGLNNNPSTSAGQDNVSFDVATGGSFHLGTPYSAGSGATMQEHTHAGTYTSGSLKLFYNGIQRSNDNFTGTLSYDTSSTGRFLWSTNSALSATVEYPGIAYWTGVWNRVLTPGEMEWLHVDPYALLIQKKQIKYFFSSNIHTAQRLRPKQWTSQPPQGVTINYGHPLAKGLVFYSLENAGAGFQKAILPPSLPGNSVGSVPSPNWIASPGGTSQNFDGNWSLYYNRQASFEPNWATVISRARRTGTVASNASLGRKTYSNGGSAPFASFGIDWNPGGAGQDTFTAYFADQTPSLHSFGNFSKPAGALANVHTYGLTIAPSGGNGLGTLYFDGISQGTLSATGMTSIGYDTSSTGNFMIVGSSSAANRAPVIAEIYFTGIWNRPLTAMEMEWIHQDPYSLLSLKPQIRYFTFPVSVKTYSFWVTLERLM